MNVEIGAEAALFPEKECISGIFLAVWVQCWKAVYQGLGSVLKGEILRTVYIV
jgi:hypothetical protein